MSRCTARSVFERHDVVQLQAHAHVGQVVRHADDARGRQVERRHPRQPVRARRLHHQPVVVDGHIRESAPRVEKRSDRELPRNVKQPPGEHAVRHIDRQRPAQVDLLEGGPQQSLRGIEAVLIAQGRSPHVGHVELVAAPAGSPAVVSRLRDCDDPLLDSTTGAGPVARSPPPSADGCTIRSCVLCRSWYRTRTVNGTGVARNLQVPANGSRHLEFGRQHVRLDGRGCCTARFRYENHPDRQRRERQGIERHRVGKEPRASAQRRAPLVPRKSSSQDAVTAADRRRWWSRRSAGPHRP